MSHEIQIEITPKCSLNCIHCSSLDLRNSVDKGIITVDRICNFVDCISGTKHIYLTGGEPLNYEGLELLCRRLHGDPNVTLGLFTSGIYTKDNHLSYVSFEDAKYLYQIGIRDCYLSLYGADKQVHNIITAVDSFDLTCKSINNLNKAGIITKAHIVLTAYNINNLEEIINLAKHLRMQSIRILHLVKHGQAVQNWDRIGVEIGRQKQVIFQTIKKYKDDSKINLSVSGFPNLMPCRPIEGAVGCQRGIEIMYITNSGEIYPCACSKGIQEAMIGTIDNMCGVREKLMKYEQVTFFSECINPL